MIQLETLHHVSVPVTDLEKARAFYEEILGLKHAAPPEQRPDFPFGGAWYDLGAGRQLHLICDTTGDSTFRRDKALDSRDAHFALRISNFDEAEQILRAHGYDEAAQDAKKEIKVTRQNLTPWQQLYIMDPDGNVIELNSERSE